MVSQVKSINYIPNFLKNPAKQFVLSNDSFSSPVSGQLRYNSTSNVPAWFNGTIERSLFDIKLNEFTSPVSDINLNNNKITNLTSGVNPNDAVNVSQLQGIQAGLDPKASVKVATVSALTGATYNPTGGTNGTGSFTSAPTTIDGIAVTNPNIRILVKDETDLKRNGIFKTVTSGTWERAEDMDGTPSGEVSAGNYTFVEEGTVNSSTGWVVQGYSSLPSTGIITLNDNTLGNITWVKFNSSGTVYTASNGVTLVGSDFQANVGEGLQILSNLITLRLNSNSGLIKNTGTGTNELSINVDNSTLELISNALQVKNLGITTSKLADNSITEAKINTSVAGNGLIGGGGTPLGVGAGIGITVNSNDVSVNTSVIPRFFINNLTGDGTTTTFTITHNANTNNYFSFVINNITGDNEEISFGRNTSDPNNKTDVVFSPAPVNGLVYTCVTVVFG